MGGAAFAKNAHVYARFSPLFEKCSRLSRQLCRPLARLRQRPNYLKGRYDRARGGEHNIDDISRIRRCDDEARTHLSVGSCSSISRPGTGAVNVPIVVEWCRTTLLPSNAHST